MKSRKDVGTLSDSVPDEVLRASEENVPDYALHVKKEQNLTKQNISEILNHWDPEDMVHMIPEELVPKTAGHLRRKKAVTNAHDLSLSILHALASISRSTRGTHQEVMDACLTERQLSEGLEYLTVADILGARNLFEEGGALYQSSPDGLIEEGEG